MINLSYHFLKKLFKMGLRLLNLKNLLFRSYIKQSSTILTDYSSVKSLLVSLCLARHFGIFLKSNHQKRKKTHFL